MLEQKFQIRKSVIRRTIVAGRLEGSSSVKVKATRTATDVPLSHRWWQAVLQGAAVDTNQTGSIRSVDLFCGSGGLSLGASRAAEAVGLEYLPLAAVDIDADALGVYRRNFRTQTQIQANVAACVDYHVYGRGSTARFAYQPEIVDKRLVHCVGATDLVLAGPPCQGHSNLNNHTRSSDPRNMLYVAVAATAVALKAKAVVIENVASILSDKTDVVGTAERMFRDSGYDVSTHTLSAAELGSAQNRRRHFLIATLKPHVSLRESAIRLAQPPMTLYEAIGDLESREPSSFMDALSVLSADNQERIDYLFDHDLYDLPNKQRPDCHKDGHSYPAVYGRLVWNKPCPTITTGFLTPGRGRYIHPTRRRTLTAREAARIQGFPDSYAFMAADQIPSRKLLAKWIGDAVPCHLGYAAVLSALTGL